MTVVTTIANVAPSITSTPPPHGRQGFEYRYDVQVLDPGVNDVMTFQGVFVPTDMDIDPSTGVVTWVPSAAQAPAWERPQPARHR